MTDEWVDRYAGYSSSGSEPTSDEDPSEAGESLQNQRAPEAQEPTSDEDPSEAGPTSEETEESTLWAGKYRSPQDLERAYQETTRESSRQARELAEQRQRLETYEQLLERLAAQPTPPSTPPPTEEEILERFHENPVKVIREMIDTRARSEREAAMREASERARAMHDRLEGLTRSFTEVALQHQIPTEQFNDIAGYAKSHPAVSALVEAGCYKEAAEIAGVLYLRDRVPLVEEEKRQAATKRKAAYVEGGRTSRGPTQKGPVELTPERIRAMSDEELDLEVANQLGGRLPESMRLNRKRSF